MKQGKTILKPATRPDSPPVVEVGTDDRGVIVDFGTMAFRLTAPFGGEGLTITLRVDGGYGVPVDIIVPHNTRSLVEFYSRDSE